jgi:transcriptional regulator with XRE-family HTH domain
LVDKSGSTAERAAMAALSRRHQDLGDAIRAWRQRRGLSQEGLGDRAGLSANYVGDVERGERNVSVRALWQIADGLQLTASQLLGDAEH